MYAHPPQQAQGNEMLNPHHIALQQHQEQQSSTSSSEEDDGAGSGMKMDGHVPPGVRQGFIKKVYTLLSIMLMTTTAIAAPFQLIDLKTVDSTTMILCQALLYFSLVVTLGMTCCCMSAMRAYPTNYIFLAVFAVLYGFIVGIFAMCYTLPSVMLAAGLTAGIFCMLTAYACVSKTDFTGLGPYLLCACFGLILSGFLATIIGLIFPCTYSILNSVWAAFGAILFSFYIVYDTQLIVGGQHRKQQFSVDDYAFATLNLYLDIINLFLYLLSLFGARK